MNRFRKHPKYTTVGIPTELAGRVRQIVEDPHSVYASMADLFKEALREKLERIAESTKKTNS